MDRIQMLTLFVAVAETGSFAGAARATGLSPPTVTRGVTALEDHLGARLLIRTTRVVRLTDVGRDYLEEVRGILADLQAADDLASGMAVRPAGHLRITAPVEFGRSFVAPILADFLDSYPDVTAELLTVDRIVNLAEEGIDVALRIDDLPSSGLIALRVGEVRRVVCGSPNYLAARGVPQTPADLVNHKIIAIGGTSHGIDWRFGRNQPERVRLKPRLFVSSVGAALELARSDWGLTRALSYQIDPDLRLGTLQTVLDAHEPDRMPVHLVHQEGRRVSAKLRRFVDFARDRLRALPVLNP
ncbi:LysR substrate-binding domain-containing protein [Pseudorhodobacter sp. MZDSW-24AT]|uniref:LysR substrate-binding domain-containing protein n=1 Tax=Pseudorhodobacter sp. MZDSW-24AT TaxID=2052957 RepID=UPI000C1EA22D|nr:LysR substrate-binding domain-containing protein [Pseudorhodobacter sp. MZDSW-24AT]PJF08025.1 LysR family transcriptional regulator [Pseudorhodobacter sp. MZDSW-24AT]